MTPEERETFEKLKWENERLKEENAKLDIFRRSVCLYEICPNPVMCESIGRCFCPKRARSPDIGKQPGWPYGPF